MKQNVEYIDHMGLWKYARWWNTFNRNEKESAQMSLMNVERLVGVDKIGSV